MQNLKFTIIHLYHSILLKQFILKKRMVMWGTIIVTWGINGCYSTRCIIASKWIKSAFVNSKPLLVIFTSYLGNDLSETTTLQLICTILFCITQYIYIGKCSMPHDCHILFFLGFSCVKLHMLEWHSTSIIVHQYRIDTLKHN